MYSGYWTVVTEEEAQEILTLFAPDRKRRWKVMPMGEIHADPQFVEIMMKLLLELVILG